MELTAIEKEIGMTQAELIEKINENSKRIDEGIARLAAINEKNRRAKEGK